MRPGVVTKDTGLVFDSAHQPGLTEPHATILHDYSRWKNHGIFKADGAPNWVQLPSGLWVMDYNGDDYVNISAIISTAQNHTVGAIKFWFKNATQDGSNRIFSASDSGDDPAFSFFDIYSVDTGKIYVNITENGAALLYFSTDDTFDDEVWHLLLFAVGVNSNVLRIDGVAVDITYGTGNAATQKWFNSVGDLDKASLGRRDWGPSSLDFTGQIAPPIIYNRIPSATKLGTGDGSFFKAEKWWFGR